MPLSAIRYEDRYEVNSCEDSAPLFLSSAPSQFSRRSGWMRERCSLRSGSWWNG